MALHTRNMLSTSVPAMNKQRVIHEAETQQKIIEDKIKKLDLEQPDYELRELIGKGAFGRVYKSLKKSTNGIVAVKILETDRMDITARGADMEAGMNDTMKEINILRRLKESGAENVNQFVEAFHFHSQLWIVNEYCSGGSLSTLRRATENKLAERYIIPIARELAKGLRAVHAAGIVHRDIKCANVMINESGKLQVIDFGVSGIILSTLEEHKRKTVIGTPHWMPPEMHQNTAEVSHGQEVDVWSYGITIYECAMGAPPHARTGPSRELRSKIRQTKAPRLPDDRFSSELANLVEFALDPDPITRPTMQAICNLPFLADSEEIYPTESLKELIDRYYLWEIGGGQRASLFMPHGAAAPEALKIEEGDEAEEWTFSTTAGFEQNQAPIIARMSMQPGFEFGGDMPEMLSHSPPTDYDDFEPYDQGTARFDDGRRTPDNLKPADNEDRVARGARAMQGLFDESASPYKYKYGPASDLPLRSEQAGSSFHRKEVSVSSSNGESRGVNIDLNSIPKKSAKRQTMAWNWNDNLGGATVPAMPSEFSMQLQPPDDPPIRPQLKHSATEPVGDRPQSTLDLDDLMGNDAAAARKTLDLDALMGHDATMEARKSTTLDLDDLMGEEERRRATLNLDDLMGQEEVRKSTTLNLDDLMGADLMARKSQMYAQPSWAPSAGPSQSSSTNHTYSDFDAEIGYTVRPVHGLSYSMGSSIIDAADMERTNVEASYDSFVQQRSPRGRASIPQPIPAAALVDNAPSGIIMEALEQQVKNWTMTLQACDAHLAGLETGSDSEDDDEDGLSQYASSSRNGSGNWNFGKPESGEETNGDDDGYYGEGETTGDDADDGDEKS